ncbi:OsmC family protein [Angustibacter luteus]|uniref:OsmC family protein n=1 Tax=Angustibacter luteus TaxID=658456 RepID=A0ABW1JBD4_9ACTN
MDADALRTLQAPLKQRYRDDPSTADTPLHASATFDEDGITCTVQTWSGETRAGLHEATGGDGQDACSGDMLLEAVLACAGVTMRSVATALGIQVRGASLAAQGRFDARGTLGVSREAPVGVQDIRLVAELDTDADDEALEKLRTLTERYCVVAQSLATPPSLTVRRAG